MVVYGTGIPSGTRIVSVDSGTQVTLSTAVTVSGSTMLSAGGSLTVTGGTLMAGAAVITLPQTVMVRGTLALGGPHVAHNVNRRVSVVFAQGPSQSVTKLPLTEPLSATGF